MRAAVLNIGTELTRGELVNSNAAWLSERLTALGFEVIEHTVIADDSERDERALQIGRVKERSLPSRSILHIVFDRSRTAHRGWR